MAGNIIFLDDLSDSELDSPLGMDAAIECAGIGTTVCDRRKALTGEDDTTPSERAQGIARTHITGAREVRYWEARTGQAAPRVRNLSFNTRRAGHFIVLTFTPALAGGCDLGEDIEPETGDPNDIDPMALLLAAGVL